MLQRLQSVWLLLASACAFCALKFPFFSGNLPGKPQNTFSYLMATTTIPLVVLDVALAVGALITIFLYKDRRLQIRIVLIGIILSLGLLYLYYHETLDFVEGNFSLSAAFTIAIPIFLFLAARGIRKDQKLIKNMDRLR